jgi:ABC-type multidrug transport system ATPase subunit
MISTKNSQMKEPVIVLNNLSKSFGDTQAVRGVSLAIPAGTIFGFLGANGAGKTTTIRMLCGLTHPTGGSARIAGRDVWQDRQQARTQFGYVAQRFSLYPDLTVEENFRFFGGACRVPPADLDEQVTRLLRLTDLEQKRSAPAGSLSGGMRQLLSLGCALVHDPPLLFLDEPTSGLDPVHRHQIWNLLYDLSHAGKTILVTTHYMDEAERCARVGYIYMSRLLAVGTPKELKGLPGVTPPGTRRLEIFSADAAGTLERIRRLPGVRQATIFGQAIFLLVDERVSPTDLGLKNEEVHPAEPTLEDVFVTLSRAQADAK